MIKIYTQNRNQKTHHSSTTLENGVGVTSLGSVIPTYLYNTRLALKQGHRKKKEKQILETN